MLKVPPALHHRRFTLLWAGQMISNAGTQMQLWALFWHVRTLSPNPVAVSWIGFARFFPVLIFSLVAGLAADVYNRRSIMFITQTCLALSALALALLTWLGHIQLWHIYLLTGINAVAGTFDGPSRQALIPNLLPKEILPSAFSLNSIANNVGAVIGPALSGLVIAYLGQQYTYLINAISFVAVILALVWMGPVAQQENADRPKGIHLAPILDGIRYIRRQPIILSSMILDFFATFFSSANTLLPYIAQDVLKVGAVPYGWLSAAQSIGSVSAALIISQRDKIRRQGVWLLGAVMFYGVATALFGVSRLFALTMFALILVGAADSVSTIIRNTIRQLQTPDYIRGRMTSINQIFFMGGPQLGEVESGLAAQFFGSPAAIVIGGAGCLVAAVWIGLRWPQLLHYNGDEPVLAGS
jgi:MFS family permease